MANTVPITPPRVPLVDPRTGDVSREWYRFFFSLFTVTGSASGVFPVTSGGTGLSTIPANGKLLIGNGSGYALNQLTAGQNIAIGNAAGNITVSFNGILPLANGGTGASNATNARTNLGLGTISTQNANAVALTGGSVDGTTIGATTPTTGAFTTLASTTGAKFATSSGNVGIGTASPTQKLSVVGNSCVSSGQLIAGSTAVYSDGAIGQPSLQWNAFVGVAVGAVSIADSTSTSFSIVFRNPNGSVGSISTSGSSTSYNTSSDYRLKDTIAPMMGALALVQQLKPVTYKWKVDGSDGQGFVAHELQEVVPACVSGQKDAVSANGEPIHQGIDTSFLVATLTAAIQEQQALIESLTTRLTALERRA